MSKTKITEKPISLGDTFKTHVKTAADRFKDTSLASIGQMFGGGHEAFGRLSTRVLADRMLKTWLYRKGQTQVAQTRGEIYKFLRDSYGDALDDQTLRNIVGLKAASRSSAQSRQTTSQPQKPQQPTQADQAATNSQTNPQPSQPTAVPFSKSIAAHLKSIFNMILTLKHPRGAARPGFQSNAPKPAMAQESRQPRLRLREAQETVPELLRMMLDIGRKGDDDTKAQVIHYIGELKRNRFTRSVPQIANLPLGNEMFDPSVTIADDNPQQTTSPLPTQSKPPPPQGQDASTGGQSPVPSQQTANLQSQAPQDQSTQAANAPAAQTPPASPSTAPTAQTTTPATPQADPVTTMFRQVGSLVSQPQVNSSQVLQTIASALHNTVKNSPEHQRMVNAIKSMQSNPNMRRLVPQLATLESRRALGRMLIEAAGENSANEPISRSEIDQMFMQVSQELMKNQNPSYDNDQDDDDDDDDNYEQQGPKWEDSANKTIKTNVLNNLIKRSANNLNRKDYICLQKILDLLKDKQDPKKFRPSITIGELDKKIMGSDLRREFTPDVKKVLLSAAYA
jgi:hypothetical protein